MRLLRTERFKRDRDKLPGPVQEQLERKLRYLAEDLAHPSLRVKRIQKYGDLYEGSINMQYRFMFEMTTDAYILVRVGKHRILDNL